MIHRHVVLANCRPSMKLPWRQKSIPACSAADASARLIVSPTSVAVSGDCKFLYEPHMRNPMRFEQVLQLLLQLRLVSVTYLVFGSVAAVEFLFNGFDDDSLLLYGDAAVRSSYLAVTNDSIFSIGRAFYEHKIPTKSSNASSTALPFSTSFIFALSPVENFRPGHGLVFLFAPAAGISGATSAQNLGLFNRTNDGDPRNHIFAVEFDVFKNPEFNDIDANHVGIDLNSLASLQAHTAGYYPDSDPSSFTNLTLNNGANYQAWIDYANSTLSVTMAPAGIRKPKRPLLSIPLNLSDLFFDEMFVGFSAATGMLVESHIVLGWSFSNSDFSAHEALITTNLPSFIPSAVSILKSKAFISWASTGGVVILLVSGVISLVWILRRRKDKHQERLEDWELEYWPHRISYQEIHEATRGFSDEQVIGVGGNGKVYRGVLRGGAEVAIKCFTRRNEESPREFTTEVSSLGRLRHRNLVALRGWCAREDGGGFMLVYDFMENGSLDKWIFEWSEERRLCWEDRVRILRDAGRAVQYLHDGWESRILHRDIKASNVMLDADMNGRLGDFGLARLQHRAQTGFTSTTRVVGTVGYLAPELVRSGRASDKTDVFGFGVLILEVICGRRPVEAGKSHLVEWVADLMKNGELPLALDPMLRRVGNLDISEVERVLLLGLICTHSDPQFRPSMKHVVQALEGPTGCDELTDRLHMYPISKEQDGPTWFHYAIERHRAHPTFNELKSSLSSSPSDFHSECSLEGR